MTMAYSDKRPLLWTKSMKKGELLYAVVFRNEKGLPSSFEVQFPSKNSFGVYAGSFFYTTTIISIFCYCGRKTFFEVRSGRRFKSTAIG